MKMEVKVLCLHGMGVNAEVFAAQSGQYGWGVDSGYYPIR
jgi:hypothetical protein